MSTSNPVAPAGYGKMLGGDANKDEKKKVEKDNLSNSDFRKLMMTPAVGGKSSFDSFKAPLAKTSGVSIKGVSASKQKYKEYYKQKEKEKKEHDAKYRDRAAERRKTEDADVVDDPTQEHSNYNMFGADGQSATSAELRNAEIERTRYLGGDVEHTHLVRGLDYALLQKVKSDITQEDEGKGEDGGDRAAETKGVDAEAVQVKSAMARNLMRTAFDTTSRYRKNESFRPGRMAYKFTLTSVYGGMENDIPTTLLRSAEEMKGKQKITQTTTNDLVIEKLASIFLAVRQGARSLSTKEGKQKKSKDKHGRERGSKHPPNEKATAHTAAVKSAEEDDEDIFADVGKDYTPSLPTPTVGRPSVGGPNPNPAQSIGAENGPKTEAGPVGPSMHPSRMKYFQGSASSLETQLPVNTGVDAQAHVNTQGAESEADPYAPTRPVVDEGDDSVTGAYGEESVTAVYGDMQVDADDATAPDGSDDVTAPYGSDAVTALYGQKDGVTAAYGQDESVTGVYGDDGNYGYAQAAPPSPAQAPEPQFNYSFTSQTAQSLAHVQAHTTQAQAQATHLPPMPVHHQHRRKPPTSSRTATGEQESRPGFGVEEEADPYGEFYPDAMGSSALAYDSEDDEKSELAFSRMDKGTAGNKGLVSRYDFDDDEAYEKAKSEQEALPKAAFQFGRKMADGRATRRHKGSSTKISKDKKIDRDLNMINQIMKNKRKESTEEGGTHKKYKRGKNN